MLRTFRIHEELLMMYSLLRHGIICGMTLSAGVPTLAAVDSISITSTSSWSGGFNGEIQFTNDGPETIEGWSLLIENGPQINSAWNCLWTSDGLVDLSLIHI